MACPRRIAIIGGPGAGKTTLARRLGAITGLTPTDLRSLDPEGVRAATAAEAWILDGNFSESWSYRVLRAELVVVLDLPLRVRRRRLLLRRLTGLMGLPVIGIGRVPAERLWCVTERPAAIQLLRDAHARGRPRCVLLRSGPAVEWFVANFRRRFC